MPNISKNKFVYYKQESGGLNLSYCPINIVVVPHTVFKQWKETIEKYTSISFFEIYNKKTMTTFKTIFDDNDGKGLYKDFFENDMILISNSRYNEFANLYLKKLGEQ